MFKRVSSLLIVIMLLLLLAACGGNQTSEQPAVEEEAPVTEAETEAEPAAEAEEAEAMEEVNLTMGSWRVDDTEQLNEIIAAFNEAYPHINIKFDPTNPPDYNSVLRTQLEGGTGPDLFYLRSFDTSLQLFEDGFVESLDGLDGLNDSFTDAAISPWATEGGEAYGVPLLAVSHGVYYNVDMFNELGLDVPTTWEELMEASQVIQDAGYTPFANATGEPWTMAEIVFMNLAPNFIGGRDGRLAYEAGERCFNDAGSVATFQAVADMAPYLPEGQEALVYYDSQQLFLLEEAAMWLGGSWDISFFESEEPEFEWSVFAVPAPAGQDEHVTFHADAGMGINAASEHKEEAKLFLSWLASDEAAALFANSLPGFFPMHENAPTIDNAHANAFLALNEGRGLDVRLAWPKLLGGNPSGYNLIQDGSIAVANGTMSPQEAADALQTGLAEWFEPAQNCEG